MSFKKVYLIVNPAAGQPEPILQTINPVFHQAEIDWQVRVTTATRSGAALAQAAIADGADLIIAYGGDGTINSVINGMIDHDVPLALLHGGTGNAVAHELKIPTELKEAAELVVNAHQMRSLDVGKVQSGDKVGYFILRSSIGLQNQLLKEATPQLKEQFGNLAYIVAGIRSLTGPENLTFELEIDGESYEAEGLTCIIANSASIGGRFNFVFAPEVKPDDGELDVFILDSKLESLISMVNNSLSSRISQYPHHWSGKEIKIQMQADDTVTLDGEPFGSTPLEISIMPKAIQILVPDGQ